MRSPKTLAWAAAVAICLLVFSIKPRYLRGGDATPAELLPISLLEHGTLTFPAADGSALPYWFHATKRGVVSTYPILPGLLNVPAYAAARTVHTDLFASRFRLSQVTASVIAALSVGFVYGILLQLTGSWRRSLGFALVYAFATLVWSVASRSLFQHGPALLLLSIGLFLLLRATPASATIAGFFLALAVLARPTTALLVLPLVAWAISSRQVSLWRLAAGAVVPAALHAAYAWKYWGSPFSLAQPVGVTSFSGDFLQGLAGLLVSPSRGLFVFSPVFLFTVPGLMRAFRPAAADDHPSLRRALATGAVLTLGVYAFWPNWWGGHSFGYRLLTELALPLTILLALDWDRIRASRLATALFAVSLVASILIQAVGRLEFPTRFNQPVDQDPSILWNIRESELDLCVRNLLGQKDDRTLAGLIPRLRPPPPSSPLWWKDSDVQWSIPGSLDSPGAGAIVLGMLTVMGWAAPGGSDPGEVMISLTPGDRRYRPDRFARPDVAAVMPQLGDVSAGGFGLRLPPPDRLEATTLLVEIRDRSGRVARIGPVSFLWGPARPASPR